MTFGELEVGDWFLYLKDNINQGPYLCIKTSEGPQRGLGKTSIDSTVRGHVFNALTAWGTIRNIGSHIIIEPAEEPEDRTPYEYYT